MSLPCSIKSVSFDLRTIVISANCGLYYVTDENEFRHNVSRERAKQLVNMKEEFILYPHKYNYSSRVVMMIENYNYNGQEYQSYHITPEVKKEEPKINNKKLLLI